MEEAVRVEEYSFATAEQRRAVAQAMSKELEQGATVLCVAPVNTIRAEDGDDMVTSRIAVFYVGGVDPAGEPEAVAVATAEPEGEETPQASIVEDIMHIPPPDEES